MLSEAEVAVKDVFGRVLAGKLTVDDGVNEVIEVTKSKVPVSLVEKRQWKRKEFSAEGNMSIAYGLDQRRASYTEKILISNISAGGVKIQSPFLSLDGLHIVGELTEEVWMPNILNLEVALPTSFPAKIRFQGSARWYLRVGTEPYYLVGVAIDIISKEHRELLFTFLLAEGSSR